jgi:hypothetical protein
MKYLLFESCNDKYVLRAVQTTKEACLKFKTKKNQFIVQEVQEE